MTRPPGRCARASGAMALLLAVAGCSDDPGPSERGLGPPASTTPAPGTQRVTCRVMSDEGPVTLSLDIPDDYAASRYESCRWRVPVAVATEQLGVPAADTIVDVYAMDGGLEDAYEEKQALSEIGGDEAVFELEFRTGVPTLGEATGDRLSYRYFNDEIASATRTVTASGIAVRWRFPPDQRGTDAAVERALASAGVVG